MAVLSENEIRHIAEMAVKQLEGQATPANVERVVRATLNRLTDAPSDKERMKKVPVSANEGGRIIITAFGANSIGILAGLTGELADLQCDIVDLTQKIMQEFFTIMLLVDTTASEFTFEAIKQRMVNKGESFNLKVIVQHEDIFKTMHRV